ncbi:MAG TPA: 2-C-methyl-D-erythritol 4-phosphate cytidylyltransferase [Xanthomonadales bacterium]|nr:2-C-methyl-D-erythritol 4-phosphate cytidylyltransferase [Xanthomonadales bacterium]
MPWCVVPAAGAGRRFGGDRPKQYQLLGGKPMLVCTLERIASHTDVEGIIVAIAPDDAWWPRIDECAGKRVIATPGGEERAHSVLAGLRALPREVAAADWVLVHDAARPCVRHEDIDHLLQRGTLHETGALLAAPVRDTIKRGNDEHEAEASVPRENLWRAFTPQLFRRGELTAALEAAIAAGATATDEAKALELAGRTALLVTGSEDNLKVTSASDLALAELILKRQAEDQG